MFPRAAISAFAVSMCAASTLLAAPAVASPAAPAAVSVAAARRVPPATKAELQTIHAIRKRVVATALTKQTARYVWGGSGPDAFDCSGLVMWTYLAATGLTLPHYSGAQMQVTRPVARTQLRKGDLLFYGPGGSQHVTMYLGRRLQIGASSPKSGIVIDSIDSPYRLANYAGAGRVIRLTHVRTGVVR